MRDSFPPSSPVPSSSVFEPVPFRHEDASFDIKDYKGPFSKSQQQHERCYPTPYPSSSVGRSSSPIRKIISSDSSPDKKEPTAPLQKAAPKLSSRSVAIEFNPASSSRLAIGRKHGICDIVLPGYKCISRQHAFISYMAFENQVKLECNGTNGCTVSLPMRWECELVQSDTNKSTFELRSCEKNLKNDEKHQHDKELVNDHLLTSFVLLKGETVTMPFVKGTILDFRQAEVILSLKRLDHFEHKGDGDNITETETEMAQPVTESDGFRSVENIPMKFDATIQHSPTTPSIRGVQPAMSPCQQTAAPSDKERSPVSVQLEIPMTPKKPRKLDLCHDTKRRIQESPLKDRRITCRRHNATAFGRNTAQSLGLKVKRENNAAGSKQLKRKSLRDKETDCSQGNVKRQKSLSILSPTDSIIGFLENHGVDCPTLQRVLVNHLAFSSVLQTPLYQLQNVNSTIATLSRGELRALLTKEHCIGIIHRQGKDAAGKPLDEEYFYDVENDSDIERRNLVLALKGGRSGLRSCRKVHKQYFWKKPGK